MATKLDFAEQWLRQYMAQHRNVPSKQIKQAASEAGISAGNLHLARQRIPDIEVVTSGYPRTSYWLYKPDEPPAPEPEKKPARQPTPPERQSREVPPRLSVADFTANARQIIAESRRQPRRTTDRWPLKD